MNFAKDLEMSRYRAYLKLTTTRRKQRKGDFALNLETLDFEYAIVEIEVTVDVETKVDSAIEDTVPFTGDNGLNFAL